MTGTRHQHEISHWAALADDADELWGWGTPAGKQRARRRAELLVELAGAEAGQRVLELGCGTGTFTELIAGFARANVIALDLSLDLLHRARARCNEAELRAPKVQFLRAGIEALPVPTASFDAVLGSSILHHLELEPAIREIHRALKPGGRLAFAEPNMMNPQVMLERNVPPIRRWRGNTPDETAFFRWLLSDELRDVGFEDVKITPYDFLHPAIPPSLIGPVSRFGEFLERLPVFREFAGSLIISARRPAAT